MSDIEFHIQSETNYKPPKTIWEVQKELKFDLPLEATDPRFADTR
jgi:hypothetical protein